MCKFLLVFVMLLSIGFTQAQVSKLVEGNIIDERTENEVEKVELYIQNYTTKKKQLAETDGDGYFAMKNNLI